MPDMGAMSPAPAAGTNATVPAAGTNATVPAAAAPPVVPPPVGQQGAMAAASVVSIKPQAGTALPSVPNVRRRW